MRVVSNSVSHTFSRKLESSGVTVAEWVVLREMYSATDNVSPSVIAESTGLSRGAISKLVERLLQKRLLSRAEAGGDRRYQNLSLTPIGRALVPKLALIADGNDEEYFSSLTRAERKQLSEILKKIVQFKDLKKVPTE